MTAVTLPDRQSYTTALFPLSPSSATKYGAAWGPASAVGGLVETEAGDCLGAAGG